MPIQPSTTQMLQIYKLHLWINLNILLNILNLKSNCRLTKSRTGGQTFNSLTPQLEQALPLDDQTQQNLKPSTKKVSKIALAAVQLITRQITPFLSLLSLLFVSRYAYAIITVINIFFFFFSVNITYNRPKPLFPPHRQHKEYKFF